jgi:plastocyanin
MLRALSASNRVAAAAILLFATACGGGDSSYPTAPGAASPPPAVVPVASAVVSMNSSSDYYSSSNTFGPNNVLIARNGSVTWNNGSGTMHNVTFESAAGAPSDVANFSSGSEARTFTSAGTYNYACSLHSGMTGQVRVE